MDTYQILNAVRQDDTMMYNFLGVFPRDMIPKHSDTGSIIANTDTSSEAGTHWVAMYRQNNLCEFFDSYGRQPFKNKFLGTKYIYNHIKLQSDYSPVCGQYCLYFLYFRSRNYNFDEIVESLKTNGDSIVAEFVGENFEKCTKGDGLCCKSLV